MGNQEGQITQIAGQLASAMPTKGVPEGEAKEAIRNTLHYAKDVGILDKLTSTIEAEAGGDPAVATLCENLRS